MSNYSPLIEYLPNVLRNVREYQALMNGEDPEIGLLWKGIKAALDDQFVTTATENGVKRWEKILRIVPRANSTLEERKFTILARLMEHLPYTIRMLENILTELCGPDGFKIHLDANAYSLQLSVEEEQMHLIHRLIKMMRSIIPANMILEAVLPERELDIQKQVEQHVGVFIDMGRAIEIKAG